MITPAALPLWLRSRGIADYGGDPNKRDYGGIGAVDYLTDVSAAQLMRLVADVTGMAAVVPLMTLRILATSRTVDGTFDVVSLQSSCGLSIDSATTYDGESPPSGYPSVINCSPLGGASHVGTNGYTIRLTLPDTATDPFGVSGQLRARFCFSPTAFAYLFDTYLGTPAAPFRLVEFDTSIDAGEYAELVIY